MTPRPILILSRSPSAASRASQQQRAGLRINTEDGNIPYEMPGSLLSLPGGLIELGR
ncbi:Hypothetical predicted protein [Xyrichtys novacula]|uniref:Uncharacterized protein n=1 Tax=Xyrichtys novacula TaxID=13765 RepID=A0AAV1F2K5_XYRNO|nr:Hypothetical predicted protein [Xyrichtys novacula]